MPRCACAAMLTAVTLFVCACVSSECNYFFCEHWAKVSVSMDLQFADLHNKALFLRYDNICLSRRIL